MLQYIEMEEDIIISKKDGRSIKVKDFRKRRKFDLDIIYKDILGDMEINRLDKVSKRLLGDELLSEDIVDVNDKDVFSINKQEEIRYPDINYAGV